MSWYNNTIHSTWYIIQYMRWLDMSPYEGTGALIYCGWSFSPMLAHTVNISTANQMSMYVTEVLCQSLEGHWRETHLDGQLNHMAAVQSGRIIWSSVSVHLRSGPNHTFLSGHELGKHTHTFWPVQFITCLLSLNCSSFMNRIPMVFTWQWVLLCYSP